MCVHDYGSVNLMCMFKEFSVVSQEWIVYASISVSPMDYKGGSVGPQGPFVVPSVIERSS